MGFSKWLKEVMQPVQRLNERVEAANIAFLDKTGNWLVGRGFVQDKARRERWAAEEAEKREALSLLRMAPDATDAVVREAANAEARRGRMGFGRRSTFLRQAAGMPAAGGMSSLLGGR